MRLLPPLLVPSLALLCFACAGEDAGSAGGAKAGTGASSPGQTGKATGPTGAPTPASSGGGGPAPAPKVDPATLPKVCGGAQGDGTGLKTVAWSVFAAAKYRIPLGAGVSTATFLDEPRDLAQPYATFDHQRARGVRRVSSQTGGSASTSLADFVASALPTTDLAANQLGYSRTVSELLDGTTTAAGTGPNGAAFFQAYASAGYASHDIELAQAFSDPLSQLGETPLYVSHLQAVAGLSWALAVHFDADCKSQALAAADVITPWSSSNAVSADALEKLLVANGATFKLLVIQTGVLDADVDAALRGTTCAPTDLAACATLFGQLDSARVRMAGTPLVDDEKSYTALVGRGAVGTSADMSGPWTIGRIDAESADSLP